MACYRGGFIPPRHSVIANSELPLRILKFRAPAAARYPGESMPGTFVRAGVAVDVEAGISRNALLTLISVHDFAKKPTKNVKINLTIFNIYLSYIKKISVLHILSNKQQ